MPNITNIDIEVLQDVISHNQDGIIIVDENRQIIYANKAFLTDHAFSSNEVLGRFPSVFLGNEKYISILDEIKDHEWSGDTDTYTAKGQCMPSHITLSEVIHKDKSITHTLIIRDNSKAKAYENALWDMAMKDSLTGLYNRRYFMEQMKRTLATNARAKKATGIILLDLDNFSNINNTMGHEAGDAVLIVLAERLKESFSRESDLVGRLGGDEFVILINDLDDDAVSHAERICKRLVEALDKPYSIDGKLLEFTASVGMAVCHTTICHKMLLAADDAMYEAKAKGKNTYSVIELN